MNDSRKTQSLFAKLAIIAGLALFFWDAAALRFSTPAYAQAPAIAPVATSIYYTANRQRNDYTAVDGQLEFVTTGQARSQYVEVFRNGILARLGSDYTQACAAVCRITLQPATKAGEFVTLFYYPN